MKKYNIKLSKNANMEQIIRALWHLRRDIISDGYDLALNALSKQAPMIIHEYPAGTECFTWIVPEKWTCHEAYLETLDGKKLFSYVDNPLHVVSYSLPFEGEISREELFKHLHVHNKLPDAIPFVFKYYERDWGLSCTKKLKEKLTDEKYRVLIKTDFSYSMLKVGEVVVPGESEECFIFAAHLCHPCSVNDGLSGVALGIDVMRRLLQRKKLRYTYRFIILPETIGSAAYLSHNENLIPKMVGGLFFDMMATSHPHMLKPSLKGNTQIDKCISSVVKKYDKRSGCANFLTEILNDERMFNAPGISIPMLSLSRSLPSKGLFEWYHTSLDTPENANFENLKESSNLVMKIIDAIEHSPVRFKISNNTCLENKIKRDIISIKDRIPKPKFRGELFCSRYEGIDYATMKQTIFNVIFYLDGTRTVADIAKMSKMDYQKAEEILDILLKHNLIEWK